MTQTKNNRHEWLGPFCVLNTRYLLVSLPLLFQDEAMVDQVQELVLFLRLAQAFKNRLQMSDRDRALVLAGTYASMLQMHPVAEFCRKLILQNNQGHMLRKWPTFAQAIEEPDFATFLKQVRRRFPTERAEIKLVELGYECDVHQQTIPPSMNLSPP